MIAGVIVILTMTAAGLPIAALLVASRPPRTFLGVSYLLGSAWCGIVLFALSLLGIRWSLVSLAVGGLVPLAMLAPFARERLQQRHAPAPVPATFPARLVDFLTFITLAGYALYATVAPMWEWDFWSLWGLNARAFFERGGLDWEILSRPEYFLSHYSAGAIAYRPLLHPLLLDAFALLRGGWDDRVIGLLFAAFAASALLVARDELEEESGSALFSSVVVLGMTGVVASRWVGNPEGMIASYITVAVLLARRALLSRDRALLGGASIIAGLAALTKDEGLTFVVALGFGITIVSRRNWRMLAGMWPAVALVVPWLFLRTSEALDAIPPLRPLADRVSEHLANPAELLSALARHSPDRPLFWIALLVALAFCARSAVRQEAFAVIILTLQLCFYLAAYVTTPFGVEWHVATSWVRLLYQLAPSLMFVAIVMLVPAVGKGRETTDQETV